MYNFLLNLLAWGGGKGRGAVGCIGWMIMINLPHLHA